MNQYCVYSEGSSWVAQERCTSGEQPAVAVVAVVSLVALRGTYGEFGETST